MFILSPSGGHFLNDSDSQERNFSDAIQYSKEDEYASKNIQDLLFISIIDEIKKENYNEFWESVKSNLILNENFNLEHFNVIKFIEEVNNERKIYKGITHDLMTKLQQHEQTSLDLEQEIKMSKIKNDILRFSIEKMNELIDTLKQIVFDLILGKRKFKFTAYNEQEIYQAAKDFYDNGVLLKDENYHMKFLELLKRHQEFLQINIKTIEDVVSTTSTLDCNITDFLASQSFLYVSVDGMEHANKTNDKAPIEYKAKRSFSNTINNKQKKSPVNKGIDLNKRKASQQVNANILNKKNESNKDKNIKPPLSNSINNSSALKPKEPQNREQPKVKKSLSFKKSSPAFSAKSVALKSESKKSNNLLKSSNKENQTQKKGNDLENLNLEAEKIYSNIQDQCSQNFQNNNSNNYKSCDINQLKTEPSFDLDEGNKGCLTVRDFSLNKNGSLRGKKVVMRITNSEEKLKSKDNILTEKNSRIDKALFLCKSYTSNKEMGTECSFGSNFNSSKEMQIMNEKIFEESMIFNNTDPTSQGFSLQYEGNILQDILLTKPPEQSETQAQLNVEDKINEKMNISTKNQLNLTLTDLEETVSPLFDPLNLESKHNIENIRFFSEGDRQILELPSPSFGNINKVLFEENSNVMSRSKSQDNIISNESSIDKQTYEPNNFNNAILQADALKKSSSSVSVAMGNLMGKLKQNYENIKPVLKKNQRVLAQQLNYFDPLIFEYQFAALFSQAFIDLAYSLVHYQYI